MRIRHHRCAETLGAAQRGQARQGGGELRGRRTVGAEEIELHRAQALGDGDEADGLDRVARRMGFEVQADQASAAA